MALPLVVTLPSNLNSGSVFSGGRMAKEPASSFTSSKPGLRRGPTAPAAATRTSSINEVKSPPLVLTPWNRSVCRPAANLKRS